LNQINNKKSYLSQIPAKLALAPPLHPYPLVKLCAMKNEKKLLNLFGLAKELHLPVDWVKNEALAGRIPCLKVGRRFRFNREAVESSLAERAKKGDG